ncbi:MAG: class E sortase, partial [Actinomycetes bacterium]
MSRAYGPRLGATLLLVALAGCTPVAVNEPAPGETTSSSTPDARSPTPHFSETPHSPATATPERASTAPTTATPGSAAPAPRPPSPSLAAARRIDSTARLSIPALGIKELRVKPYAGTPDDGPGTRIQNRGLAASPYGPAGGEGPGQIGNYIVTGHRTSHGAPFADLPDLADGAEVRVTAGGTTFVYRVTGTQRTSFRSERSL